MALVSAVLMKFPATRMIPAAADTTALEHEIDPQVYALYGLTAEEIAIVEGTAK